VGSGYDHRVYPLAPMNRLENSMDRLLRRRLPHGRFEWSFSTTDPWILARYQMDPVLWSNGTLTYGEGQRAHGVRQPR
jgi:hypothetical protein